MFDLIDMMCANTIGIPVEEYIDKVEKLSERRMNIVIQTIMNLHFEIDITKLNKVKNIFTLIQ